MNNTPVCPNCDILMVKRPSKFPGRPFFYGCKNYPNCTYRIGVHPNGEVLGTPCDDETAQARIRAHDIFDKIWKEWDYTRQEAYSLLQTIMAMTVNEAHIAKFNKEQCEILIKRLENYFNCGKKLT